MRIKNSSHFIELIFKIPQNNIERIMRTMRKLPFNIQLKSADDRMKYLNYICYYPQYVIRQIKFASLRN